MAQTPARPTLNPVLRAFWTAPARNRVLHGGRASSKSWDAAGFAVYLATNAKLRFLCVRQYQNRISESVYALLKIQIERFGLQSRFDIQRDKIFSATGSEFMFYGLWRSIDEIKSLESIDVLWVEEAHNLTEEQWKVLEPTIRKAGSQIWIIFNPRLATDFAYRRFVLNPPPNTIVRQINYDENMFLSKTMLDIIEAARLEDPDEFAHIYGGQPKEDDNEAIIKRSWILASVDAHKKLGFEAIGKKRLGFDIADSGIDKCATIGTHGSVVQTADMWKAAEDELLTSCSRAYRTAQQYGAEITYDCIGVGASAGAKFAEINDSLKPVIPVRYVKFNAGGAIWRPESEYSRGVKNKDMFSNIKAQAWWLVADRFRNTYNAVRRGEAFKPEQMISIAGDLPHLNQLVDELSTPKKDYDAHSRVKVESKKDLDKRDVPSPNLADALIMSFAPTGGAAAGIF